MLVPTSGVGELLGVGGLLQGLEAGNIGLGGRVAIRNKVQSVPAVSFWVDVVVVVAQPKSLRKGVGAICVAGSSRVQLQCFRLFGIKLDRQVRSCWS